jgi:hypothetical protein
MTGVRIGSGRSRATLSQKFLQEKSVEATKQKKKGERRKKPKPEEQEGIGHT